MTDKQLSPTAQAVLDAFYCELRINYEQGGLAAALRAVVQELKCFGITEKNILSIANELEGK